MQGNARHHKRWLGCHTASRRVLCASRRSAIKSRSHTAPYAPQCVTRPISMKIELNRADIYDVQSRHRASILATGSIIEIYTDPIQLHFLVS